MKLRTTEKNVKQSFDKIINVSCGNSQHLLYFEEPAAYTSGVYGWNADIYDYGKAAIVQGYRGFKAFKADYDLIDEYNDQAAQIVHNDDLTIEEKKNKIKSLIDEFIKVA